MKEIKFRAWHKSCEVMIDWDNLKYSNKFKGTSDLSLFYDILFTRKHDFETMQFTGLKDKKGKEIYEGDIVVFDRGIGNWTGHRMSTTHEIVFSEEVFAFVMNYSNSYIKLRKHWNYIYEVIGNIYENKELLNN